MNDQTKNDKALPGPATLHMPPQTAPIDRTVSPGALAGTPGVEADLKFLSRRLGGPVWSPLGADGAALWPTIKDALN